MFLSSFLFRIARLLLPLCAVATIWLYLFPLFHRCSFPKPAAAGRPCDGAPICAHQRNVDDAAPFRLLAFGDPQLEGDSSLPDNGAPHFPSLSRLFSLHDVSTPVSSIPNIAVDIFRDFIKDDLRKFLVSSRKQLDLLGNDYYLAHIYRTLNWWTNPTHVTVLGDLLGSQWVSDEEFGRRSKRYWERVFKGSRKVAENVMWKQDETERKEDEPKGHAVEFLGESDWSQSLINIAGNHDIGYAGDIDPHRIERFEQTFGRVNWDIRFVLPSSNSSSSMPSPDSGPDTAETTAGPPNLSQQSPSLHVIVLNSMNLDGPVLHPDLQQSTFDFLNSVILQSSRPVEDRSSFTLLLTHIPLYKPTGVCVDGPFFDYFPSNSGGGVKEQNHLSEQASKTLLEAVFGMSGREDAPMRGLGRNGLIVNGHDHEGCDVWHQIAYGEETWQASRYERSSASHNAADGDAGAPKTTPKIREVTLRAMMGEFGGNAGLISLWFDWKIGEWQFAVNKCALGVQHWWWAVHVADLVVLGMMVVATGLKMIGKLSRPAAMSAIGSNFARKAVSGKQD